MQDYIEDDVFDRYPTFVRGVVVAHDATIPDYDAGIAALLEGTQSQRQQEGTQLLQDPRLTVWDEAHRQFGSNPRKYPPSIRSLAERVVRGGRPLPFVNTVVSIFNHISLRFLLPCGGDDLATVAGDLCLGFAHGTERFIALGNTEDEAVPEGEVIYYDTGSDTVCCRKWNWRNGDPTKITPRTTALLINVDGLGECVRPAVEAASQELARLLQSVGGGIVRCEVLDTDRRSTTV